MFRTLTFNNRIITYGGSILQTQLDPLTSTLLDYAGDFGYQLPTNIIALNGLIKAINPILDKLDLMYLFNANGDVNFRTLNVVNPEMYKASAFGGLIWSESGVKGNGTNGYLDTNFNPSLAPVGQKYQINNASMGAIIDKRGSTNAVVNGIITGFGGRINITENSRINSGSSGLFPAFITGATGLSVLQRISDTDLVGIFRDVETLGSTPSFGLDASNRLILARYNTASVMNYGAVLLSMYFEGAALTFAESQTLRAAFNNYLVNINQTPIA